MLVALVNYEVRRKGKQSSSNCTSAEALMVRSRGSNRKGKSQRERSKSRANFRDLKKNQRAFCKELGHWKVDYPRIKDKKRESKPEANLAQVVSTQAGTLQAGGSDSDSLVFAFSVITHTVGYSCDSEWILDRGVTYHVCPNRN